MNTIKDKTLAPIEAIWSWWGSKRFYFAATAAVAVAVAFLVVDTAKIVGKRAQSQQAIIISQDALTPGQPAPLRVMVRDERGNQPIAGAKVVFAIYGGDSAAVWQAQALSDASGMAEVQTTLAETLKQGSYTLKVQAHSNKGRSDVSRTFQVKRSFKLMVSTDKPLYQPGQKIRIRTLALANSNLHPIARQPVVFEILDAKGNKVFKKKALTSAFGIASTDFQLADQVNKGRYTIAVTLGDTRSERNVEVKFYRLPKFRLELETERGSYAPGDTVKGTVSARYIFGKSVANATVRLNAIEFIAKEHIFATLSGKTDAEGRFSFSLRLKDAFVGTDFSKGDASITFEATVTDAADHRQKKARELIVTTRPLRVDLFAESGTLVKGVDNLIYLITSYPDGRPAKTELTLGSGTERKVLKTNSVGLVTFRLKPESDELNLQIIARDKTGKTTTIQRKLTVNESLDAFLLRTDRAIYRTGETIKVEAVSSQGGGMVFVDVVKDRRTLFSKSIPIAAGRGQLALDLPTNAFGTLQLHAYRIKKNGQITADTRVIQVNRANQLQITAKLNKSVYRPAEKALLELLVKRRNGKPVKAALSLVGVDEAVYALHEMRPGLARIYFMLQEEILRPRFELHGHLPLAHSRILDDDPKNRQASQALFALAGGHTRPTPVASRTLAQKRNDIYRQQRKRTATLWSITGLIPLSVFFTLGLCLLAYGGQRLLSGKPLQAAEDNNRASLLEALRGVNIWWVLGLYLPLASAVVVGLIVRRRYENTVMLVVGGGLALTAAIKQSLWVRRWRRNELSRTLPMLRKLIWAIPAAYVLLLAGSASVIAVVEEFRRHTWLRDAAPWIFGAAAFFFFALIGMLAGTSAGLKKTISRGRFGWIAFSRMLVSLLPIAVLGLLSVFMVRYDRAGAMPPMMVDQEGAVFNKGIAPGPMKDDAGAIGKRIAADGTSLKSPSRIRRYFPETLLWLPELLTGDNGRARLEIPLADSITTWRVGLSAVSAAGELGASDAKIRVFQDFFIDIDAPLALTQNDRVSIPVAVYNYLDKEQKVRLELKKASWYKLHSASVQELSIGPKQVTRVFFTVQASKVGHHALAVLAHGSELADAIERQIRVSPDGKAVVRIFNGHLDKDEVQHTFEIPKAAIDGASDLLLKIYPGSFSQVLEGLDNIFRMPYGCFEQTSSATYPNILVLDYLRRTKQNKPELEMKALNFINVGYQRLLSYEVSGGGFEWFGKTPAHTVLTAYGLMEFSDMAKVYEIDPALLSRTREWLFKKQESDGSWNPPAGGIAEGAINAYRGQVLRTTAYVAWAMAESAAAEKKPRDRRLDAALDYLMRQVLSETDNYTLALATNALLAAKDPRASKVLNRLMDAKRSEGKFTYWTSEGQGATYSKGKILNIETTALAAYALLKARQETAVAHKALAWLVQHKDKNGTWHSTQATVHALRALLLATGKTGGVDADLALTVKLNGKVVQRLKVNKDNSDVFQLVSLRGNQRVGHNGFLLEATGTGSVAYQLVSTHYLPWAPGHDPQQTQQKPALSIDLDYDTKQLKPNDLLTGKVRIEYHRRGSAKMAIVDLGIPPGFELLGDAFEKLVQDGTIERYSLTGRQAIIYLRSVDFGKPLEFSYQLRAKYPVKAKTPRSRVYQYYQPSVEAVAKPVKITVL